MSTGPIERKGAVIFLRGLDHDLKAHFKAWCSRRGKSMTQVIVDFMTEKTTGRKKQPKKAKIRIGE
jgi:hypothetical protein